jgi:hypothetical protein
MQAVYGAPSSFDALAIVHEPRGRQGRRYPVGSLLAVLTLVAMNGDSSLRGMWLWAKAHAELLTARLSFHCQRIPALETSRTILCQLDRVPLLEAFSAWLAACDAERISFVAAPPGM